MPVLCVYLEDECEKIIKGTAWVIVGNSIAGWLVCLVCSNTVMKSGKEYSSILEGTPPSLYQRLGIVVTPSLTGSAVGPWAGRGGRNANEERSPPAAESSLTQSSLL